MKNISIKHRILLIIASSLSLIVLLAFLHGRFRTMPEGTHFESEWMPTSHVEFLYDLTYRIDEITKQEQAIFPRIFKIIEEAEETLVVDMFLFNNEYDHNHTYPSISIPLAQAIAQKKITHPDINIHVISDPINTFYGAYEGEALKIIKAADVPLTLTNLDRLRHSNALFSAVYAPFLSHFGVKGKGWIPNPFSPDSPKITLRAFLKMLNFKANHRKIILSEKEAIVSSANPHDGSANHCNIAFSLKGPIIEQLLIAESHVVRFSNGTPLSTTTTVPSSTPEGAQTKLVTEGKIRKLWLEVIDDCQKGDSIQIAMFYMGERKIVRALAKAAKRGVHVKMILDANKDAFGREKNGMPNRQIASELILKFPEQVNVRWYHTEGEQFHSKLLRADQKSVGKTLIIGGSANLTRRNIANYNLEADVAFKLPRQHALGIEVNQYFERMWNNSDGYFTDDYETFQDDSFGKKCLYRFQELTGLCTW